RPGHADPAFGANPLAEFRIVRVAMTGTMRIECTRGDFLGEKRTHLRAQLFAFGRQADLVEVEGGGHAILSSAGRDKRPEFVGTAPGDVLAKLGCPVAVIAEVVAP